MMIQSWILTLVLDTSPLIESKKDPILIPILKQLPRLSSRGGGLNAKGIELEKGERESVKIARREALANGSRVRTNLE